MLRANAALVGVRGFDSRAGLPPALRWSAKRVPRRWGRETRRIQAYGRPFADVPHDGARHTALRRRVGNGRVLPGSTPGAGTEVNDDTSRTTG